jgi:hypothetical protein
VTRKDADRINLLVRNYGPDRDACLGGIMLEFHVNYKGAEELVRVAQSKLSKAKKEE